MRAVEWTPLAEADLKSIDQYLSAIDEDFAERAASLARAAATFLTNVPHAGAASVREDIRKWNVRRTPYILIYRITAVRIEVLRVHHNRENWRGD